MNYTFIDLVDIEQIRRLAEKLVEITAVPMGIMGQDGTIYLQVGWQDFGERFHLSQSQVSEYFAEMHHRISIPGQSGCSIYQCGNERYHAAAPVYVEEVQLACVYFGQFFYEDDVLDDEYYRQQARKFGLDEQTYLDALKKIPVYSRQKIKNLLTFFEELVVALAKTGLVRFKELQMQKDLAEREIRFQELANMLPQPVFETNAAGRLTYANRQALLTFGYNEVDFERGIYILDTIAPLEHLRARQKMANARRDEVSQNEYTALHKDGRFFPVIIYSTPVYHQDKFSGFRGVIVDVSTIKQVEENARQNFRLFQSLFDNALSGILMLELVFDEQDQPVNYRLLDINSSGELIMGINRRTALGKMVTEILNAPHPFLLDEFIQVAQSGVANHLEVFSPFIQKYLDISIAPLEKASFFAIVNDITGRKNAEKILKENEEKYRTLIETTDTGFVILDQQGVVIDANQEYIKLTGKMSMEDIVGHLVTEWTAAYDLARNAEEVKLCLEKGHLRNFEIDYVNPQGEITPIEINATVLNTAEGVRILSLCRNIHERKQTEYALQASEARLQEAQHVSHTGSWDLDLATKTMWASVEAHRIYGLELAPDLILPLPVAQNLVERPYRSILDSALNDLILSGGQKPYNVEFFIRRHDDGERRAVQSIARLVKDEHGRPVRVSGTIQDITERKLVEEEILKLNTHLEQRVRERTAQLEAANKELEAFAYSVSHDLRAPLRALNGFSHMLSEDYAQVLDETGHEYLQRISAATINMSRLIDGILRLSRITRSEMLVGLVDLTAIAIQIVADLQSSQPERIVDWQITPGMVVQADADLMRIALINLLGNAWKFTSKTSAPRIAFGVEHQNDMPIFFVRDNGAGFDMAYQHKLFNAFQRLHADQDFEGTGIGLAIVQRIILRHGGKIWAESAVDEGAVFFFTLFE